jgi:2-polyprenyl-6-methoxyphenol hydroxylase-like FAD-dependent oxidoreductase
VNFGVTVESVEPARETPPETRRTSTPIAGPASRTLRPTVRLRTGEIHHADVIIGADGQRSTIRRVVTDEDEEPGTISYGMSYYTGSIPMTEIRKYAPLNQLLDVGSSWPIWFGGSRGALGMSSSFYPGMFLLFF